MTKIEKEFGRKMTLEERSTVKKLRTIAKDLADDCCSEINDAVEQVPDKPVKYKAQYTLEYLVQILKERI